MGIYEFCMGYIGLRVVYEDLGAYKRLDGD